MIVMVAVIVTLIAIVTVLVIVSASAMETLVVIGILVGIVIDLCYFCCLRARTEK